MEEKNYIGTYQGLSKSNRLITGYLIENQADHKKYIIPDIRTIASGKISLCNYEVKNESIGAFINEVDNKSKRLYVNDKVKIVVCSKAGIASATPIDLIGVIEYSVRYKVFYIKTPTDTVLFQGDSKYIILSITKKESRKKK